MELWISMSRLSDVKVFARLVSKLCGKILARQDAQENNNETKDQMNHPTKSTLANVCTYVRKT